ncbi:hypothetical protein GCM10009636_22760 [Arthrobacter koreensis]
MTDAIGSPKEARARRSSVAMGSGTGITIPTQHGLSGIRPLPPRAAPDEVWTVEFV